MSLRYFTLKWENENWMVFKEFLSCFMVFKYIYLYIYKGRGSDRLEYLILLSGKIGRVVLL